jgi:hypothetical protein
VLKLIEFGVAGRWDIPIIWIGLTIFVLLLICFWLLSGFPNSSEFTRGKSLLVSAILEKVEKEVNKQV